MAEGECPMCQRYVKFAVVRGCGFIWVEIRIIMWQSQVENEHYSTVSGPIRLVILSLECFIEITPDFLCPFMND